MQKDYSVYKRVLCMYLDLVVYMFCLIRHNGAHRHDHCLVARIDDVGDAPSPMRVRHIAGVVCHPVADAPRRLWTASRCRQVRDAVERAPRGKVVVVVGEPGGEMGDNIWGINWRI